MRGDDLMKPTKRIINRYLSIKQDGQEIYCEDLPKSGGLEPHLTNAGNGSTACIGPCLKAIGK